MEQSGQVPEDINDFLKETSEKIALCERKLEVPTEVLNVLRQDVDTLSTRPADSADRLSRTHRDFVHDIKIALMKDLQNIRFIVTQLGQHCQHLTDVIHQVSMDVPKFLEEIGLRHLEGNFSQGTTVQQLLNLHNIEGEMTTLHRRRLERELGKIRARIESGAGISEIPPTLHRLLETTTHLITSCLDKLKEWVSVTADIREESSRARWLPGRVYDTFMSFTWQRSSDSEDTFTVRHRETIDRIEKEQLHLFPTPGVDNVTPGLTEFVLKNDLQTFSSVKTFIDNISTELLNVNSSVEKLYKQANEIADSL
ncbi:Hypp266 [Branchiostoma lanceolatum]|uniref:Hypp266 protein n=1 Tax=Branchiostoma lanceolatum TaxID=7740 RepID=A0A8J9VKX1_BRALA|nr:Hypp266 [Branchiostoma lanceolatum]